MQLRHPALHGASLWGDDFLLPPSITAPAPTSAPPVPPVALESVLNSIGELVYFWDLVTDRITWTGNLVRTLGILGEVDLSTGIAFGDRLSPESVVSRYEAIVKSDRKDEGDGVPYQLVYALLQPRDLGGSGSVWVEDTGRWFGGPDGRPSHAQGVLRVVTERHDAERLNARHAHFDPLTGLLNRAHLSDKLQRLVDTAERSRKPFALLLVGLENLFALNRNETIYFTATKDDGGQTLDGKCRYEIHGRDPNARWWSITAYGDDDFLIPNPENIYSVSTTNVVRGKDGSFSIAVGGARGTNANWIPTGDGAFSLSLRLYNPGPDVALDPSQAALPSLKRIACP